MVRALRNDRYILRKIGEHEGPSQTSSAADFMKLWVSGEDDVDRDSEGDEEEEGCEYSGRILGQNGRV